LTSVLGRIKSARWSSRSPAVADAEAERLEKRRATNRRSQQKSRDDKEALIRRLQEEVARLKERINPTDLYVSLESRTGPRLTSGRAASDSVSG